MLDYALINNTSGAFPLVISNNSTGPGNLDGTPYIKNFIDDLWGFSQALMSAASLTPNAVQESATASQRLEALRRVSGYPGEVVCWMGDQADPSSLGIRLLPLNGQTITIATYPELVASTYVGDPANPTASAFYKTSDTPGTVRNVAGPYFVLPDLRGAFIRGLDTSGTIDPNGAGRDIGNLQNWAIYDHTHDVWNGTLQMHDDVYTTSAGAVKLGQLSFPAVGASVYANTIFDTTFSTALGAANLNTSESRPVNYTGRWCIRY
jgi:hypothetical protein